MSVKKKASVGEKKAFLTTRHTGPVGTLAPHSRRPSRQRRPQWSSTPLSGPEEGSRHGLQKGLTGEVSAGPGLRSSRDSSCCATGRRLGQYPSYRTRKGSRVGRWASFSKDHRKNLWAPNDSSIAMTEKNNHTSGSSSSHIRLMKATRAPKITTASRKSTISSITLFFQHRLFFLYKWQRTAPYAASPRPCGVPWSASSAHRAWRRVALTKWLARRA